MGRLQTRNIGEDPNHTGDPADWVAAQCPPSEIEDSIEDCIREVLHPAKVSDLQVRKLVELFAGHTEPASNTPSLEQRTQMLNEFIEQFHPTKWTLINWWAMHFAVHSKSVDGISPAELCRMAQIRRNRFAYYVKYWRKVFGLPKNPDLHRESVRLAWRRKHAETKQRSHRLFWEPPKKLVHR